MDDRQQILEACDDLNKAGILQQKVSVEGIQTATNEKFEEIVHYFLDSIETVSESKEHLLPNSVKTIYNKLVDGDISFGCSGLCQSCETTSSEGVEEDSILPEVLNIEFTRTIN